MWGTSWANIMLTMLDAQLTDYQRDNNKSKANGRSNDSEVLDLSDPKNIEYLKKFAQ